MNGRLILCDTSNFEDFPIGGQLTSIHNFLHYICEQHPERTERIILVGLTLRPEQVGRLMPFTMFGCRMWYLPVMLGEADLSHTKRSVRVQYVKGLLKYARQLSLNREDCVYINTPEAFGPLRLLAPRARFVAFTHQNYFDMVRSFRFYQNRRLVLWGFDRYLYWMLRRLNLVFALSAPAEEAYRRAGARRVQRVCNSIVCPADVTPGQISRHRMIFVGRLSLNTGIETIIQAVQSLPEVYTLKVVGEGEEHDRLIPYASDRIRFTGSVTPAQVQDYMRDSDILIMNSGYEGLPMTILEAQSLGLPVVTTDVGGIGEAVHYGVDAEPTQATVETIQESIALIEGDYARYSAAAIENARRFDYRTVNREVYDALTEFWR